MKKKKKKKIEEDEVVFPSDRVRVRGGDERA
jgi:hypothetical protein